MGPTNFNGGLVGAHRAGRSRTTPAWQQLALELVLASDRGGRAALLLVGSHSVTNLQGTTDYFEAACVPLSKLLKEHGHDHVDLLKVDIEGAEHTVIDWLLQSGVLPRILAVEFDQPTPWRKVRHSVNRLRDAGYELVAIDIWNYTFVRPRPAIEIPDFPS